MLSDLGIKRIINTYNSTDEQPSFAIDDNQIKIILPVVGYDYHKLNEEEGIITYLKAHPNASRSKMESKLQIERATLLRRLSELIEKDLVKKTGNGPNVTYYI